MKEREGLNEKMVCNDKIDGFDLIIIFFVAFFFFFYSNCFIIQMPKKGAMYFCIETTALFL